MAPHDLGSDPINLAHEQPFRLGEVEVYPAIRQVIRDGRSETLEPRVMQVLVALAQAGGAILTRGELIERCWGGTIVGENAIQRAISKVRQLAEAFGPDSFDVETITKVGYRIVLGGVVAATAPPAPPPATERRLEFDRRLLLGGAGTVLALGMAGIWFWRDADRAPPAEALALLRKGREFEGAGTLENAEQALAYFREATRIAPDYAEAWGALALAYRNVGGYAQRAGDKGLEARARSAAARTFELDAGNPDARAALVLLRPHFGNWAAVENGCRAILRDHPRHLLTQARLGVLLMDVGRMSAAVDALRRTIALDPLLPLSTYRLIRALWSTGRLEDAEQMLDAALKRWPRHGAIWDTKFVLLAHSGRPSAALAFARDPSIRPIDYPDPEFEATLATARALESGSRTDSDAAVALNVATAERSPAFVAGSAQNCAALGRVDLAFALFDGYYFARGRWAATAPGPPGPRTNRATVFLFYPHMAPLRRDARFAALTDEIGLEDYWRTSATRPDYRAS